MSYYISIFLPNNTEVYKRCKLSSAEKIGIAYASIITGNKITFYNIEESPNMIFYGKAESIGNGYIYPDVAQDSNDVSKSSIAGQYVEFVDKFTDNKIFDSKDWYKILNKDIYNAYYLLVNNNLIAIYNINTLKAFILAISWLSDNINEIITHTFFRNYPIEINIETSGNCPNDLILSIDMNVDYLFELMDNYILRYNITYNYIPLSDNMLLELLINDYNLSDIKVPENKIKQLINEYWIDISKNIESYLVKNILPLIKEYRF